MSRADVKPSLSTTAAAVMVTRRCTMRCGHCSVESHPKLRREPAEEDVIAGVNGLIEAGVTSIQVTGGEPMLRPELVLEILRLASARGVACVMTTNGFWGKSPQRAEVTLGRLLDAGLRHLTVSFDRYHAEFQGPEPVLNIVRAAERRGFGLRLNVTRTGDDSDLDGLLAAFRGFPGLEMRFYDLQPVGFARELRAEEFRMELDGFCSACEQAVLADDGRMLACNGPSYFVAPSSPLHLGRPAQDGFGELLRRHWQDPVIHTIRTQGPGGLLRELRQVPGFESWGEQSARGTCELCLRICTDPQAVDALRQRLSGSLAASHRLALELVMKSSRRLGVLNRQFVNHTGAAEAFLAMLTGATRVDHRVLGRADFDWEHQAVVLERQGLLGLLAPHIDSPTLRRWAPAFFRERIARRSREGALRCGRERRLLRALDESLAVEGVNGWLLGESGLRALGNPRTVSGWRLYLPSWARDGVARRLAGMLEESQRSGLRLLNRLPGPWLQHRDLPRVTLEGFDNLQVTAPGHRVAEIGAGLLDRAFYQGMAAAWDLHWCLQRWPASIPVPESLWPVVQRVPTLAGVVPMPAPRGIRQRAMFAVARPRVFGEASQDNPLLPLGVALLASGDPGWWLRELGQLLSGLGRQASRQGWPATLRQAWTQAAMAVASALRLARQQDA